MNRSKVVMVVALALAAGCSTASPKGETTVTRAEAVRPPCPLGVDGARVGVEDTPDGVMLTFTSAEKTDELRTRVRDAAAMYGPRKMGQGHDGKHAQGGHHGLMPMQMPPAYAASEDVPSGARLRLTPVEPADLPALRARAHERAAAMSGTCD